MIKIKNVNFKYQGLGQSGLTDINLEIKKANVCFCVALQVVERQPLQGL